ncbi:MAG: hypothetical protein U0797_25965 [Gemmataceae bacterium]
MHSDPFVIDWDGDGDLDLLSGSSDMAASTWRRTSPARARSPS